MLIRLTLSIAVFALGAATSFAQPVVNSAVNSASYLTPPGPSATTSAAAPIAQGSIFVVFGTGLGPPGLSQVSSFPLPTNFNGTSISVTAGGQTVSAFMVYTLATQVAAILPSNTPVGPATLTLTSNGQTSKPLNILVAKSVPGVYTVNSQGTGQAAAQVAFSGTDIRTNNLTIPGTPGSTMILYATGLGPISGADDQPPGAVTVGGNVTVTVGGKAATVLYHGRAPQFPGEDQINIQLPTDVPFGCYTPAVVVVDGIPSNDFVIPTAAAGSTSCVHPFGLNAAAEAKLDSGGTVNVGIFGAVRGAVPPIVAEGGGGLFETVNASQLFATYTTLVSNFHVNYYPAPAGGCVVYDQLNPSPAATPIPNDFKIIGGTELQSAASLTLSGPNSASQGILRAGDGSPGSGYLWTHLISDFSPATLGSGTWALSGAAGPDVGAFMAQTEFPTNLTWTNMGNLNTPPVANGITMTWTGGGTTAQPNVNIFGYSSVYNSADASKMRGKAFSCIVPADLKQFVIPADITKQLPVPAANETEIGELGISIGNGAQFNANLLNGQPLDGSWFSFGYAFVNNGSAFSWK